MENKNEKLYDGYEGKVIATEIMNVKNVLFEGNMNYRQQSQALESKVRGTFPGLTSEQYIEVIEDFDL